jgi:hypothetical protein
MENHRLWFSKISVEDERQQSLNHRCFPRNHLTHFSVMNWERAMGIEPRSEAWGNPVSAAPTIAPSLNRSSAVADEGRRRLLICLALTFFAILGFHDLAIFPAIATIFAFFYMKQIPVPVPYRLGLLGALVLATVVVQILHVHGDSVRDSAEASAEPQRPQTQVSQSPTLPPPKFTLFRGKKDEIVTFVVPTDTTDEQLKSLIWLFREKVRSGKYEDIGIFVPTAKQWGVDGYDSGMLAVYRGKKCASEGYVPMAEFQKGHLGPCGYGDHSAAGYQWGINGVPEQDAGDIMTTDGTDVEIFKWTDNWLPSAK